MKASCVWPRHSSHDSESESTDCQWTTGMTCHVLLRGIRVAGIEPSYGGRRPGLGSEARAAAPMPECDGIGAASRASRMWPQAAVAGISCSEPGLGAGQ